jgi:hypothetical protein
MTDTNILFSSLLLPKSRPAKALFYIIEQHNLILCDYIITELRNVISWKRPDLLADIDLFLTNLPYELIPAPIQPSKLISDPNLGLGAKKWVCYFFHSGVAGTAVGGHFD